MGIVEENIKKQLDDKNQTLGWLADKIGMSRSGFYKTIENESLKVETLLKIAQALDVPVISLIDRKESNMHKFYAQRDLFFKNVLDGVIDKLKRILLLIELNKSVKADDLVDDIKFLVEMSEGSITRYLNYLLMSLDEDRETAVIDFIEKLNKETRDLFNSDTSKPNQ